MFKIEELEQCPKSVDVERIAQTYRIVFGNDPWNEGLKCPVCGAIFPLGNPSILVCPHCIDVGGPVSLVEYWPQATVVSDFYREMRKPAAHCLVVKDNGGEVIGFAWGYEITITGEADCHLEAPGLCRLLGRGSTYFYGDEVAVNKDYRGLCLGTQLVQALFEGRKKVLLRTLAGSTMHHIVERLGGGIVLEISRGRIMMTLER